MGILDFFRSKPEPEIRAASVVPVKRTYAAAQNTARFGDIRSSRGSADTELLNALADVRAKSRWMGRNSPTMRRYINLMRTNVVGRSGFRFQSRVKRQDGTQDATLNARVERQWARWWAHPTVDGRMTGHQLLRQAVAQWCQDGEVLWEIVFNNAYPRDGMAINPLEADHLDETLNTVNPSTKNQIRMSVEFNSLGQIVAYHLLTTHPGDQTWYSPTTQNRYRRVSAENIIHVYDAERPKQTRGAPPAAAVINPSKMRDGHTEAVTVGRRLRAAIMGFFVRDQQAQTGISELADAEDEADEILEMYIEPGLMKELPTGVRMEKFDPGGEQSDFEKFDMQVKKDISMGLNISTMSLGMEVSGVSYSSGRTVTIEDRDYYKEMQMFFIEGLMHPLFTVWLRRNSVSETSDIPPSRLDAIRENFVFRPRGWDWVDPAKDVSANVEALSSGQTSLTRIAADRGMDLDELLDEIESERQAIAKRKGLTFILNGGNAVQGNAEASEDDQQDSND
jgi:lambda family phage portal protein